MPDLDNPDEQEVKASLDAVLDRIEISDVVEDLVLNVLLGADPKDRQLELSSEHAFDYDGCIGNNQGEKKTPEELVESEAEFWADVKHIMHEETKGLPKDRRCISIATARQSYEADRYASEYNNNKLISCFPLYTYLGNYLGVENDYFLLSDAQSQLEDDTSFERAVDPDYQGEHAGWHFDASKISLIYAKAHRAATYNLYGLALLTFYDDRKDILDAVHHFFTENKRLLPHNLILKLRHRERGQKMSDTYLYPPIYGIEAEQDSLRIDYNYRETTRRVGEYIASFLREAFVYDAVVGKNLPVIKPINIPEIIKLNLEEVIYDLRTAPQKMEAEALEKRVREAKIKLGGMIFEAPSQIQSIREAAVSDPDKMFSSVFDAPDAVDEVETEVSATLDDLKLSVVSAASEEDRFGETSVEVCLDYDNCIGNGVGGKLTPEALVAADAPFWQVVSDEIHTESSGLPRDRRCISSGSARQSKPCDDINIENNDSTSSFELYNYVAAYLDCDIDKLLLSDIKGSLATGTSWEQAIDSEYTGLHEDWYFDESKITLLYARMHRAAMCNPNGQAIFIFYDDRKDILDALYQFFNDNIDLLPPNIELRLRRRDQYENASCEYPKIFGRSDNILDINYKETTRRIGAYIDTLSIKTPFSDPETKEDKVSIEYLNIPAIMALDLGQMIYDVRNAFFQEAEAHETEDESLSSSSLPEQLDAGERIEAPNGSPTQIGHMIFTPPQSDTLSGDLASKNDGYDSAHTI